VGIKASGIGLILSVVALAILLPVLIFIATATRLSAASREQRFAGLAVQHNDRAHVKVGDCPGYGGQQRYTADGGSPDPDVSPASHGDVLRAKSAESAT
jgi:hypothetical protein